VPGGGFRAVALEVSARMVPPGGGLDGQCATVTHMADHVGVRELRQNLSRYLDEVKRGSTLVVTERGREVARLIPSGVGDAVLGRLATERGATLPTARLGDVKPRRRAKGKPSREVLDELRGERF
jgi:prevent-host-death family protein